MNKKDIMQSFTTEHVYTIDSYDLDKIISEYINHPFEFVPTEEASNDTVHRFSVDTNAGKDESELVCRLRSGKQESYCTSSVLDLMCRDGLLEEGIYMVEVCW
jgi:hypothetical protein